MKRLIAVAAFLAALSGAALADEKIVRLDDPALELSGAVWKTMDVRFSESFAKDRLSSPDVDMLPVTELPEGKICFQDGPEDAIDPASAAFKDFVRADTGDFCVPRADVSARYTPVEQPAGAPPPPFYYIDKKNCRWTWVEGKDIGVWYELCSYEGAAVDAAFNDATGELQIKPKNSEEEPYTILRQFRAAGGPEALLPELRKKGLTADTDECTFQTIKEPLVPLPEDWTAWEVGPTGKLKDAFDKTPEGDIPEPPCGTLGLAVDYVAFFMVHKGHADRVIYVELGQDVSALDLPSITLK